MKSSELIKRLQEIDPTGDTEVCVDNVDILWVGREPAYYDGRLQVMERDLSNPYYNVTGFRIVANGDKLNIHAHSWKDALWDNPDMPVTTDPPYAHDDERIKKYRAGVKRRLEAMSSLTAIRQHIASLPEQEETEWVKELRRIVE